MTDNIGVNMPAIHYSFLYVSFTHGHLHMNFVQRLSRTTFGELLLGLGKR